MKLLSILLISALFLTACKQTKLSILDQVMTVDDFSNAQEIRTNVLKECAMNPGELHNDPNCINAAKSYEKESLAKPIHRF